MAHAAPRLTLDLEGGRWAVCRLDPAVSLPPWAAEALVSLTRSAEEQTVVCPESSVAPDTVHEAGWRCVRIAGTFPFTATGILASVLGPLASGNVSIFVFSAYSTDYLLIKEDSLPRAIELLHRAGHTVRTGGTFP